MKNILLISLLSLCVWELQAQTPCGTTDYENYLGQKFPEFNNALSKSRAEALNAVQHLGKAGNDTVYRIPVVFHVVWNKQEQNIHDSLIHSQLKALNESFRKRNNDTSTIRTLFKPLAADSKIEFYLADKNPNGQATNGINRVFTTRADFGEANFFGEIVKSSADQGVDPWNTNFYLNIWVCKFTFNGTVAIAAYAFPPTNAKFWSAQNFTANNLQGVVINYQFVGKNNPNDKSASTLREKTLVHEVGHFLGLRHIWADKNNRCTGEDDGLQDTPNAGSATTSCNKTKNSCTDASNDRPDMIENYMDYSPYPCTVMFTTEQINLMRFNLLKLRSSLPKLAITFAEPPTPEKFNVSPNPMHSELQIEFVEKGNYQLRVTDMLGQTVIDTEIEIGENHRYKSSLNVAAGFYYLQITQKQGDFSYKKKIIIQ